MRLDVLTLLTPGSPTNLVAAKAGTGSAGGAVANRLDDSVVSIITAPPTVDVSPPGKALPFSWGAPVSGTDAVELDPVTVTVVADTDPAFAGFPLGELVSRIEGGSLIVTVPGGRRIRALHLAKLHGVDEDADLGNADQVSAVGWRLAVSVPASGGGWAAPVASVPALGRSGQLPATLTGASFAHGVLRLPDIAGGRIRISLVEGGRPDEFSVHPLTAGTVTGWAAPTPVDLALTGPDGGILWNFPGDLPSSATQTADVTVGVAAFVEKQRSAGTTIGGTLTFAAKFPARAAVRVSAVRGNLLRRLKGTSTIELAGEPVRLPTTGHPLDAAAPTTVISDVTVTYRGLRLADVSDPLPTTGATSGSVVRQDPVLRRLPPLALRGETISRIGLVGWCSEPTALLVRLVAAAGPGGPERAAAGPDSTGTAGRALGAPATATLAPSAGPGVVWVDLPKAAPIAEPVAIEVSAGAGAFRWVGEPQPLVRIVVIDPDPGNRAVLLGQATLLTVGTPTLTVSRAALPAAPFAGPAPLLASALFCTVELTDIELRYRRGA